MTIGDNFREKREAMGLTQEQAAAGMLVRQSYYSQVEIGMKIPSVAVVKLASELFGCTTDELIYGGERRGA